MKLSDLRPAEGARHSKKRVGRGPASGLGTTAGRGMNGQNSRSGGGTRPGFEGGQTPLHRRLPKRGFKNRFRKEYVVINLDLLEKRFEANEVVDVERLVNEGIVKRLLSGVKILGDGELTKALTVRAHKFSKTAIEKIEKAGGKIEVI